jgi:hypothetical protein
LEGCARIVDDQFGAAGGDAHLGGDDWDAAIVQWLQQIYLQPAGVDTSSSSMAARLKGLAEYAKVSLSDNEQVIIRCGPSYAWFILFCVSVCMSFLPRFTVLLAIPGAADRGCAFCTVIGSPYATGLIADHARLCCCGLLCWQDACRWPQRWPSSGQLEPSTV